MKALMSRDNQTWLRVLLLGIWFAAVVPWTAMYTSLTTPRTDLLNVVQFQSRLGHIERAAAKNPAYNLYDFGKDALALNALQNRLSDRRDPRGENYSLFLERRLRAQLHQKAKTYFLSTVPRPPAGHAHAYDEDSLVRMEQNRIWAALTPPPDPKMAGRLIAWFQFAYILGMILMVPYCLSKVAVETKDWREAWAVGVYSFKEMLVAIALPMFGAAFYEPHLTWTHRVWREQDKCKQLDPTYERWREHDRLEQELIDRVDPLPAIMAVWKVLRRNPETHKPWRREMWHAVYLTAVAAVYISTGQTAVYAADTGKEGEWTSPLTGLMYVNSTSPFTWTTQAEHFFLFFDDQTSSWEVDFYNFTGDPAMEVSKRWNGKAGKLQFQYGPTVGYDLAHGRFTYGGLLGNATFPIGSSRFFSGPLYAVGTPDGDMQLNAPNWRLLHPLGKGSQWSAGVGGGTFFTVGQPLFARIGPVIQYTCKKVTARLRLGHNVAGPSMGLLDEVRVEAAFSLK